MALTLSKAYPSNQSDPSKSERTAEIIVPIESHMSVCISGQTTLAAFVKLKELSKLTVSLDGNPRPGLHRSKVRQEIRKTASSNIDVAQFHEYNCGITIMADEKEIIDIGGKMHLWLTNASIVNGATTFTSLRDMKSAEINDDQLVLVTTMRFSQGEFLHRAVMAKNTSKALTTTTRAHHAGYFSWFKRHLDAVPQRFINFHEASNVDSSAINASIAMQMLSFLIVPHDHQPDKESERRTPKFSSGAGIYSSYVKVHEIYQKNTCQFDDLTSKDILNTFLISEKIHTTFSRITDNNMRARLLETKSVSMLFTQYNSNKKGGEETKCKRLYKGFHFPILFAIIKTASNFESTGSNFAVNWKYPIEDIFLAIDDLSEFLTTTWSEGISSDSNGKNTTQWLSAYEKFENYFNNLNSKPKKAPNKKKA